MHVVHDRVNAPDLKPPKKDWRIKALLTSASRDQTRFNLTCIGLSHGHWFSTDGHRMMIVNKLDHLIGLQEQNRIYDAEGFAKGILIPQDSQYKPVNWKQLLPDITKARHCFELDVPQWMANVKTKYKGESAPKISIKTCADNRPYFTTQYKDALTTVNLGYLAPLAGLSGVKVYIIDANSPVLFTGDGWSYVLMSVRA